MSSPFPGMDPYLEQAARWSGVHSRLIAVLGELLTHHVAPNYFVDSEDHVYILAPDDPGRPYVRPDLYVIEAVEAVLATAAQRARGQIATPTLVEIPAAEEVRYPYLVVRDSADRQVIAKIEVLSPINKVPGSSGQRDFVHKRDQILRSTAHWIEIDLLRAGTRPLELPGPVNSAMYYAALHRAGGPTTLEVWLAPLRQELPTIPVPLRGSVPDVPLDLQDAVGTLYQRYRYDVAIDYSESPPPPPLNPADAAWAEARISAWRQAHQATGAAMPASGDPPVQG